MRKFLTQYVGGAFMVGIVMAAGMFFLHRNKMTIEKVFLSYIFFLVFIAIAVSCLELVWAFNPTLRNQVRWCRLGFGAPWTYPAKDSRLFDARTKIALILHDLARKTNDAFNEEREAQTAYQDAIIRRVLDQPSNVCVDTAKAVYVKSQQNAKKVKARFYAAWDFVKSLGLPELRRALALAPHKFADEKDYRQTLSNYR